MTSNLFFPIPLSTKTLDVNTLDDFNSNRITRILTTDFPQYFAIITRIRQEIHAIGPEGGILSSTVVPQVQAIFPENSLTKKIKVGLQVGNDDEPSHASKAANKKRRILGSFRLGKALQRLLFWRTKRHSGLDGEDRHQMASSSSESTALKECSEEKVAATLAPSSTVVTTEQLNLVSSLPKSGDDKKVKDRLSTVDHVQLLASSANVGTFEQTAKVDEEEGGGESAKSESKFAMWVLINNNTISDSSENQGNPNSAAMAADNGEISVLSADSAIGVLSNNNNNNNTTTEYDDCNVSLVSETETEEYLTRSDSRRNNIFHIVNIRPTFSSSNGFLRQRKIDLDDSALETTYSGDALSSANAAVTSTISEQKQEQSRSRHSSGSSTLNQFSMTSDGQKCSKEDKSDIPKSKQSKAKKGRKTNSSSGSSSLSFVTLLFPRVTMLSKMV